MSTVGHGPTHPNGHKEGTDIATGNHADPQEESARTAPNTDRPSSVTPHPEDYVSDNGVADHGSVAPDVQPMPQTVPLHPEIQPKLDHEECSKHNGEVHIEAGESDGTEDEDDEDEGDEDDNEEDEDEDEDEEPALKYERFGGAFQDLSQEGFLLPLLSYLTSTW